jgi:hypothetical protein
LFAIIRHIMPEGAPRPRGVETGANLGGADSSYAPRGFEAKHSPEIAETGAEFPPTQCGVRVKIREWPAKYGGIFREGTGMSVKMRCDDCPAVKFDETLWTDHTDRDLAARRAELRQDAATVFLSGCGKLSESERQDPSNLPPALQSK